MKRIQLTAPFLAVALLAAPAALPAANGNWASTFAATESGHRLGNPEAPTSLVTFVSYSCPHCASFEKQADAPLRTDYVRGGKVSVEVRHVIRNPIDLAAALSTECGGEDGFFARHRAMMMAHDSWMKSASSAAPAQQERWSTGNLGERMQAIAGDLGFPALMQQQGIAPAALDRCLADEEMAKHLAATSQAQGQRYSIPGTPSFMVNGKLLDGVHTWPALQNALDAQS